MLSLHGEICDGFLIGHTLVKP